MCKKITTKEFNQKLIDIYGKQFELLSEYVNNETKVKLKCNKCNNIIYKKPLKMTGCTKEGCYICSGKNHYKTKETLQKEVENKFGKIYIIKENYVNARTPILIKNIVCKHEYKISPDNLLRGKGCPKCTIKQSSFMNITEEILSSLNVKFIKEKTFNDCRNIRLLPFDYYLPDYNACIEVDGQFHFREINTYNGKSSYLETIKRDNIKNDYCKNNNIPLLRLPYYKVNNFEKLIKDFLQVNIEVNTLITKGKVSL